MELTISANRGPVAAVWRRVMWTGVKRALFHAGPAVLVAALCGCAGGPSYPPPVSIPETTPDSEAPGTDREAETENPVYDTPNASIRPGVRESSSTLAAVSSLVEEGWSLYAQGQWQEAIATAERGLRIQRRAAELYLLLARAYLALDNPEQARAFAHQGLRYSRERSVTEKLQSLLSSVN